jgi:hypothetical protein
VHPRDGADSGSSTSSRRIELERTQEVAAIVHRGALAEAVDQEPELDRLGLLMFAIEGSCTG